MTGFAVTFDPPIPPARKRHAVVPNWTALYATAEASNLPELDPRYKLAGRSFSYYPADAPGVLGDLLCEADAFAARADHGMTLCGYTVLLVEFRGNRAFFRDPVNSFVTGGEPIGDGFDAQAVEEALRSAADAVWEWIYPNAD